MFKTSLTLTLIFTRQVTLNLPQMGDRILAKNRQPRKVSQPSLNQGLVILDFFKVCRSLQQQTQEGGPAEISKTA